MLPANNDRISGEMTDTRWVVSEGPAEVTQVGQPNHAGAVEHPGVFLGPEGPATPTETGFLLS